MYDDEDETPPRMEEPPSIAQEKPGEQQGSPSKCPERLIDLTRTSFRAPTGGTWIDNGAKVNEELLAIVPQKARKMQTIFQKGYMDLHFEGQVGFICIEKDQSGEPKSCLPVTALHNIAQSKDSPDAEYARSTAMFHTFNTGLPFPEAGAELDKFTPYELVCSTEMSTPWKHGIDIAWSSLRITAAPSDPASLHIVKNCFERVRGDFVCWVGQRVGIAIYSETGATPATAGGDPDVGQAELDRIYGPPRQTHIYTGKITFAGSHHIEYDINAFEGCAGAIVFLLGLETQPEDSGVTPNDVGKAIAVHAGAHPRKIKNIGFKITAKLPQV